MDAKKKKRKKCKNGVERRNEKDRLRKKKRKNVR